MSDKQEIPPIFTKIILIALVLGLLYGTYRHFSIKHHFESDEVEKAFSIGEIYKYQPGARNAPDFRYEFEVNGKNYDGMHIIDEPKLRSKTSDELRKYIGKKYKVWYVIEDPAYNKLLLDKPVK